MNRITYKNGYKYQLCGDYRCMVGFEPKREILTEWIELSHVGQILIRNGYAWDGPSGPTVDTPNFMRGSLVHDALYQLLRERYLQPEFRAQADDCLYRICLEDGMSRFRAWIVYQSVKRFGGPSADPKHDRPRIVAP